MSLTTEVDFDLLNDCFELGTFHGLRKPHDDDILKRPEVQVLVQGEYFTDGVTCQFRRVCFTSKYSRLCSNWITIT